MTLEIPEGCTIPEVERYIREAVASWCRQYRPPGGYGSDDPGDPLFSLNGDSVKCRVMREPEKNFLPPVVLVE